MSRVVWDESLSVGVELIDEQHQKWIGHLNDVSAALESQEGPSHIVRTLGFLSDYTEYHFSTEEKQMAVHGYPDLEAHRAKHAELKQALANLMQDFEEDGATQALAEAVDTFLQEKGIVLEGDS